MKVEIRANKSRGGAEVATLVLPGRVEHCVTACGGSLAEMSGVVEESALALGAVEKERFVFAGVGADRAAAGFSDGLSSWLQGDSNREGSEDAVQAFAMSGCATESVKVNGRTLGYVYEDEHAHYCRLCGITPEHIASRSGQTREVLGIAKAALEKASFKFTDTVRTWFYLDHLLEWYGEFNRERTAFFERENVFGKMVPASTGIGAGNSDGAALSLGLVAVRPKSDKVKIQSVSSPMQGSALSYKSSFSRAVEMDFPDHRSLFISGTASIDPDGASARLGDVEGQIDLTMRVVEALLKSRGMGWEDSFRGIAYFKNGADKGLMDKFMKKNSIPAFPLALVTADVCRDDLLFELELDAVQIQSR